jgi:hypothetical protein
MRLKDSRKSLLSHKKLGTRQSLIQGDLRQTLSNRKPKANNHQINSVIPIQIDEEVK